MTYKDWMEDVDFQLVRLFGMSQDELPDWLSRDAFEEGLTPLEAAYQCLEEVGYIDMVEA
jgi:hypothetical protein